MIDRMPVAVVVGVLVAGAGCATAPAPPPLAAAHCIVVDDRARSRITIAANDPVTAFDDHAYSPARLVGAQMHETLVRVDCTGTPVAGLADGWSTADGIQWHFRIAAGGTFADGTAVDAPAIVAAWSTVSTPRLAAVVATGGHDLHVTLHAPADVRQFALPELAIVRAGADGWPVGTGPYSPDSTLDRGGLRLLARPRDSPSWYSPDTIDVRRYDGDLRAAIDADLDVVVARAAATVAYARARPDYLAEPLPWDRTYLLATRVSLNDFEPTHAAAMFPAEVARASARAAAGPFWWQDCATSRLTSETAADGRVLYAGDDETARAIAERLVALARNQPPDWLAELVRSSGAAPRAVGVTAPELFAALRSGTALMIIAALPRTRYEGCQLPAGHPYHVLLQEWHVTPLIDARHHLVYRPGIGRVIVDGDGMIRFGTR